MADDVPHVHLPLEHDWFVAHGVQPPVPAEHVFESAPHVQFPEAHVSPAAHVVAQPLQLPESVCALTQAPLQQMYGEPQLIVEPLQKLVQKCEVVSQKGLPGSTVQSALEAQPAQPPLAPGTQAAEPPVHTVQVAFVGFVRQLLTLSLAEWMHTPLAQQPSQLAAVHVQALFAQTLPSPHACPLQSGSAQSVRPS